jgi:PAS domain S-box-containing protein
MDRRTFFSKLRDQDWLASGLVALAYFALCLLGLGWLRGRAAMVAGNLAVLPVGLWVLRATLGLRATPLASRLRRAWTYLGLAGLLWTLGGVAWALYALFNVPLPLPSLGDPLYMAGHFVALTALLSFLGLPGGRLGRARLFLDLAIVSGAVAVLGWLLLLEPLLILLASQPTVAAWMVLYPTLDVLLLVILADVYMALEPGEFRSAWGWVGLGVILFVAADLLYTYLSLRGQVDNHLPFDLGRVLALSALGAGSLFQRARLAGPTRPLRRGLVQRTQAILPLAMVLVLGWYTFLDWQITGEADLLAVPMTLLLVLALVARQGVVAGEVELGQYAHLVNSVADPAFICDANGCLKLVNPALVAASGYAAAADLLEHSVLTFLAPLSLSAAVEEEGGRPPAQPGDLAQLLKLGLEQGWSGEVEWIRRDGGRFPAYLALRPLEGEVSTHAVLAGTAHDLTEQKRQQAELRQAYEQVTAAQQALQALNQQLEHKVGEKTASLSEAYERLSQQNQALQALDRLKSEFVSLVSHELRAPLTNIAGGIELTLMRPEALPVSARDTLALVQAEIQRLTQFVEAILDLSALEAGRLPLYPAPLALASAVTTVRAKFAAARLSSPNSARLHFDLPSDLPPVLADERGLTSVFFHLLDNALKYAPEGAVEVTAWAEASQVYVAVTDHGPGISPKAAGLIFEKFQRLNSGDAQAVYGHGLGLYMVRRLLQAMAGDVRCEPAPGGGARFIFWLPAAASEAAAGEAAAGEAGMG